MTAAAPPNFGHAVAPAAPVLVPSRRFQRVKATDLHYDKFDRPNVWRVRLECGHFVDQPAWQPNGDSEDGRPAHCLVILPSLRARRCYRCIPLPKRDRKAAS